MIPRNLLFSVAAMVAISAGIAIYMWRMRSRVINSSPNPVPAHVAPPASGPPEPVTLYVAYDDVGVLKPQAFRLPLAAERQQRAEQVLRAVLAIYQQTPSPHPLGAGSEIKSVYLLDPDLAVIDVNSAFSTGHPSGVLVEELTIASVIETLSTNVAGIKRVKILVDGKTQDTLAGHAYLADFYDAAAVHELSTQLQSSP